MRTAVSVTPGSAPAAKAATANAAAINKRLVWRVTPPATLLMTIPPRYDYALHGPRRLFSGPAGLLIALMRRSAPRHGAHDEKRSLRNFLANVANCYRLLQGGPRRLQWQHVLQRRGTWKQLC